MGPRSKPPEPPATPREAMVDPAARLREAGLVFTLQRRAIWSALSGRSDHPTADQLFEALGGPDSGISRTTVYRTLEAFVDAGLIQRVGHLGTAVRYDPRTGRHHHLVCESCGAVRDVDDAALEPDGRLSLREDALEGFEVRELSVLVRGRCPACRATQG